MMAIAPEALGKVGKLLPRLASNHDGEVVATARAIIRSLQSHGSDLHDLVGHLTQPAVERVVCREREAPAEKATRPAPEFDASFSSAEIVRLAELLLDVNICVLSSSEAKFVRQMMNSARHRKGQFRMTVRQADWFRSIVAEFLEQEQSA